MPQPTAMPRDASASFAQARQASRRTLIYLNLVLVLLISVFAFVALSILKARVQDDAAESLETVLDSTSASVQLWVNQEFQAIRNVAKEPHLQQLVLSQVARYRDKQSLLDNPVLEALRERLAVVRSLDDHSGFFVIAADGTSVASMRDANVGSTNLIRLQRPELLARALAGETVLVPPIPSDVAIAGTKNIAGRDVPPTMFFLTPVRSPEGSVVAVLAFRSDPSAMFSRLAALGRVGDTGDFYFFDRMGHLLTQSRFDQQLVALGALQQNEQSILSVEIRDPLGNLLKGHRGRVREVLPYTEMAASAVRGISGKNVSGYRDYRGVPVIGVWRWLDDLGMGVAAEISQTEVTATYRRAKYAALMFLFATVLIMLLFSLLIRRIGTGASKALHRMNEQLETKVARRTRSLAESEARLALIVDNIPAMISLKDRDGRYQLVNAMFSKITGIPSKDVLGKKDASLFSKPVAASAEITDTHVMHARKTVREEERVESSGDGTRVFLKSKVPIINDAGDLNGVLSVSMDITEQEAILAELEEAKGYLSYAEERWRAIVDNLGLGVVTASRKGVIQTFSLTASKMFGYNVDEMIGRDVTLLLAEGERRGYSAYLSEDLPPELQRPVKYKQNVIGRRRNGEEFPMEALVSPLSFHGERLFVVILQDVTEQRLLEAELRRAIAAAEAASDTKSEFLASMSHEIRTPMNGVLGMLGLLARSALTKSQKHKLDIAKSSAQSLLSIINDILDFSKVEAGQLELEEVNFNLRELIENVAQSLAYQAYERQLEFVLDLRDIKITRVKGDPSRIRQILTNLITNAIKFTDQGEVVVRAKLESSGLSQLNFTCSVIDSGIGIPTEKIDDLFSSFVQADSSITRKYGGTGLGLAICKRLTALMGGDIQALSEPGKGSEFRFHVCLGESPQSRPVCPRIDVSGLQVLIVDDNQINRIVFREQMAQWDVHVIEAASVDEGVAICRAAVASGDRPLPDLVLVDMSMPGKDGKDFAREFKADENLKHVKLLLMSSISLDELGDLKSLGFSACFTKPVCTSDLFDALAICAGDNDSGMSIVTKNTLAGSAGDEEEDDFNKLYRWPEGTRLLLVEDNQINQIVVQETLETLSLDCDVAGNGFEAIASLKVAPDDAPYTFVFMDCQMPEMDGYEATQRIRKGEAGDRYKGITIVAMTANAMHGDKEKCLAVGMNDYLSKPLDVIRVRRKLHKWLSITPSDTIAHTLDSQPNSTQKVRQKANAEQPQSNAAQQTVSHSELRVPEVLHTANFDKKRPSIARKPAAYVKLLTMFVENNANYRDDLLQALSAQDHDAVHHLVHSIKGSSGNLGFMKVFEYCKTIEANRGEEGEYDKDDIDTLEGLVALSFEDAREIISANQT